jgi:hypothetical protein
MSLKDFRFGLDVRRTKQPRSPSTHIYLQSIVRHANGMLFVTPECVTLAEMESQVSHLKDELDDVLRQARRAFSVVPKIEI